MYFIARKDRLPRQAGGAHRARQSVLLLRCCPTQVICSDFSAATDVGLLITATVHSNGSATLSQQPCDGLLHPVLHSKHDYKVLKNIEESPTLG